tara:strand:- start:1168 stop:1782 length:615 start_codon:yes stop_codon:yes gene_type:complete
MFILISPENIIHNEGAIYNQLFGEGLPFLHLRKPEVKEAYFLNLLEEIDPIYHSKIHLHHHHNLAHSYVIGGLHFTENHRKLLGENLDAELERCIKAGLKSSTSIHSLVDYSPSQFNYYLLSPLFDSISKSGYLGKKIKLEKGFENIVGLGGISEFNLDQAQALGYQNIAIMGAVWKSEKPLQSFQKIWRKFLEVYSPKIENCA